MLCELLAERLNVDSKKVAIGGNNYMKRQVVTELDITTADPSPLPGR